MALVLRTVTATRYVTPLREGGSLPGIVEADDDGLYVLKFRGAGQGPKALAAEIVAGELARSLGLPVPELVLIDLDPALGNAEPDPEIQELIAASAGINLGVDFLPGSLPYNPEQPPGEQLAADVVWLDSLVTNVDRTPRNPNLLRWHTDLYLIDHGAALYAFHAPDPLERANGKFPAIRDRLAEATSFGPSRRLAATLEPASDPVVVGRMLDETDQARSLIEERPGVGIGAARDIGPAIERGR